MSIGERLKELRKHYGLTQQEFGARIGLSQTAIGMYETGKRNIDDRTTLLICKEYHVNKEWLQDGIGNKIAISYDFTLERLSEENNLSLLEKSIISAFLHLSSTQRQTIYEVACAIADSYRNIKEFNLQSEDDHISKIVKDQLKKDGLI